ncbi:MAG: hypothetical protein Q6363_010065 [Candidatus Njordarchaeota archaeon]
MAKNKIDTIKLPKKDDYVYYYPARVRKVGGSLHVILLHSIVKALNIEEGDIVDIAIINVKKQKEKKAQ